MDIGSDAVCQIKAQVDVLQLAAYVQSELTSRFNPIHHLKDSSVTQLSIKGCVEGAIQYHFCNITLM